jgi:hypothetical protein
MLGKEPAVIIGGVAEIIRAVIPMMIIFGYLSWTDNQLAQVMLVIGVAVAVGEKWFTRSQVVPTDKANAQIETAIRMPAGSTLKEVIKKEERESQ